MQQEKLSLANFSERLRYALEKKGAKPTPIAKKLGISSGYLSELLKGIKDKPSLETLRKLSGELGCSIEWLEMGSGDYFQSRNAQSSTNPKDRGETSAEKIADMQRRAFERIELTDERMDECIDELRMRLTRMRHQPLRKKREALLQECHTRLAEYGTWLDVVLDGPQETTPKPEPES